MTTIELTAETWARLTQPLDTAPPVIVTPATRAAADAYREHLRTARPADEQLVDGWVLEAWEATFDPLDAWLEHGRTA